MVSPYTEKSLDLAVNHTDPAATSIPHNSDMSQMSLSVCSTCDWSVESPATLGFTPSGWISMATLDLASADIADVGMNLRQQAADEPRPIQHERPYRTLDVKTLSSHVRISKTMVEAQSKMLQKSKEVIQGLDNQIVSDLILIDRQYEILQKKDDELLRLTNRLQKNNYELEMAGLLINDVAEELAYQHRELKLAISLAKRSKAHQSQLLSLLEESSRYGHEPVQTVIDNWKPISMENDVISNLRADNETVDELLGIVNVRKEEYSSPEKWV
ncbi:hypothetical protein ACHAQH_001818 [Verticillium albo-atrum]